MKYKVVTDCSANLTELTVPFASVPLHIYVGEDEFIDNEAVDIPAMLRALADYKGKTSTSCPSPQDWLQAFGDAEVVFCAVISSNISGAHASALTAKQLYEEEHPDRTVYVIDSLSTGPVLTLLVQRLEELIHAGLDHAEINRQILEYNSHVQLYFSLAAVDNFAKNGRINPLIAKGIGVLGIRIIGNTGGTGILHPLHKRRGERKALACLIEQLKLEGYSGGNIIIAHSENPDAATMLAQMIEAEFGDVPCQIFKNRALCTYYAEPGSLLLGFEY